MLLVEDLYAGYGTSEVLTGVSLKVGQGKVVALIGANGAGKTGGFRRAETGKRADTARWKAGTGL